MTSSLLATVAAAANPPVPETQAAPALAAQAAPAPGAPTMAPRADALAQAAEIAGLCAAAGVPALASGLIREGANVDQARQRIAAAAEIRAAVDLARKSCPQIDPAFADQCIAAGAGIEHVRAQLFEKMAAAQAAAPTVAQHGAGASSAAPKGLSASEIYAARAQARAQRGPLVA